MTLLANARAQTWSQADEVLSREAADIQSLETRLDNVSRERDRAIAALTEASRKLMELEDRLERPGAR